MPFSNDSKPSTPLVASESTKNPLLAISQAKPPIKPLTGSPSVFVAGVEVSSDQRNLADRVESFYSQLTAVAADLNVASDELGRSIVTLDAALKKLNLGISTWVRVVGHEDQELNFWVHKLGYAKIADKWGIALQTVEGNHADPDGIVAAEWLFNDAPRTLRLEAVEELPKLLEQLIKDAQSTSQKIREKVSYADQIAVAIGKAANIAAPRK